MIEDIKLTMDPTEESKETISTVVSAIDDLPIAERLKFVKNIVFDRGGDEASIPQNAEMVIVANILRDVITVLEGAHPKAAKSRTTVSDVKFMQEARKTRRTRDPG